MPDPNQTITFPGFANLNGTVSDDALPPGSALTTNWSKLSGPGSVIFSNPNSSVTSASFGSHGAYVLRLTASDTELTAIDDIAVTVIIRASATADFVVPESTGAAGAFVIASSGATSSTLAADKTLDSDNLTYWNTNGASNQFAKIQFFDQQMVFIDRVRLQSRQGAVSNLTLKDFEVQISATTSDDASFVTALTATLLNNGQLQEFVFPAGPQRGALPEADRQKQLRRRKQHYARHFQSCGRGQRRQHHLAAGTIECGARPISRAHRKRRRDLHLELFRRHKFRDQLAGLLHWWLANRRDYK